MVCRRWKLSPPRVTACGIQKKSNKWFKTCKVEFWIVSFLGCQNRSSHVNWYKDNLNALIGRFKGADVSSGVSRSGSGLQLSSFCTFRGAAFRHLFSHHCSWFFLFSPLIQVFSKRPWCYWSWEALPAVFWCLAGSQAAKWWLLLQSGVVRSNLWVWTVWLRDFLNEAVIRPVLQLSTIRVKNQPFSTHKPLAQPVLELPGLPVRFCMEILQDTSVHQLQTCPDVFRSAGMNDLLHQVTVLAQMSSLSQSPVQLWHFRPLRHCHGAKLYKMLTQTEVRREMLQQNGIFILSKFVPDDSCC